jgi:SET domain-containing protein
MLQAIRDIKAGEEITAYYTLYNPTKWVQLHLN